MEEALAKHPGELYASNAHFPQFGHNKEDDALFRYLLISSSQQHNNLVEELDWDIVMEILVREFCRPMSGADPMRIEKLLDILDFNESLKLLMSMPNSSLVLANNLSEHSKIQTFVIDFINDARDVIIPETRIFDVLYQKNPLQLLPTEDDLNLIIESLSRKKAS